MEVGGGGIGRGRFRTQRRGETCSALGEEVVRAVVERGRGGGNEGVGTVREGGGGGLYYYFETGGWCVVAG